MCCIGKLAVLYGWGEEAAELFGSRPWPRRAPKYINFNLRYLIKLNVEIPFN
jgi:hypothetical protein